MFDVVFIMDSELDAKVSASFSMEATPQDIRSVRLLQRLGNTLEPDWAMLDESVRQEMVSDGLDDFVRSFICHTNVGPDEADGVPGWWIIPHLDGAEMTQTCRADCEWIEIESGAYGGTLPA
jgi:hypothetical protein